MKERQIVSVSEMRELDQLTLKEQGIISYELLEHADECIFTLIMNNEFYPKVDKT